MMIANATGCSSIYEPPSRLLRTARAGRGPAAEFPLRGQCRWSGHEIIPIAPVKIANLMTKGSNATSATTPAGAMKKWLDAREDAAVTRGRHNITHLESASADLQETL